MGLKDKIFAGLAAAGSIVAAIFYVLFKQAKNEQKQLEQECKATMDKLQEVAGINEAQAAAIEAGKKVDKENEEKLQEARSGNNLTAFDAVNELLSK